MLPVKPENGHSSHNSPGILFPHYICASYFLKQFRRSGCIQLTGIFSPFPVRQSLYLLHQTFPPVSGFDNMQKILPLSFPPALALILIARIFRSFCYKKKMPASLSYEIRDSLFPHCIRELPESRPHRRHHFLKYRQSLHPMKSPLSGLQFFLPADPKVLSRIEPLYIFRQISILIHHHFLIHSVSLLHF